MKIRAMGLPAVILLTACGQSLGGAEETATYNMCISGGLNEETCACMATTIRDTLSEDAFGVQEEVAQLLVDGRSSDGMSAELKVGEMAMEDPALFGSLEAASQAARDKCL